MLTEIRRMYFCGRRLCGLEKGREAKEAQVEMVAIKILKQWKNLIFILFVLFTENGFSKKGEKTSASKHAAEEQMP